MNSNETSGPTEMDCSENEQTNGAGAPRDPVNGQNGNLDLGDDGEAISDDDSNGIADSGDDSDETEVEDEEDDEEGDEESEEGENSDESDAESAEPTSGSTSTTVTAPRSPTNQPTCYICLNEFEGQDVGSPDSCENFHHFCLECIEEWSKQVNTCPVDRKSFSFIIVKRDINGEVIMKVPVTKTSVLEIEAMDDDLTYCEICGRCDREDRLLLCDGCDFGFHCECLSPPLEEIPIDEWFCPECFDRIFGDDASPETYRRQPSARRAIARTGAFEIVRNRILARRTTEPGRSASTSTSTRRTTVTRTPTRKRKTTRRKTRKTRKTTKKTTKSGAKKGKRKTKKRRKSKRSRKSKLSTQRLPTSMAVRNRLASILGISKPKASHALPSVKMSKIITVADVRASAGIGNLSIFGHEHDLYEPRSYGEDFDFETSDSGYGGVGLMARPRSHFSHSISKSIKAPEPAIASHSSVDILGEIMSSMEILRTSTSDLTIARGGRVQLKADAKCIKKCPDSNTSSSSPPPNSNGGGSGSNGNGSSNTNNGYLKHSEQSAPGSSHPESDISLVKPSPVVSLLDEKPDFELYSDIESVGDNKEESEETPEKKSKPAGSGDNCDTTPVTSERTDGNPGGETRPSDTAATTTKDGENDEDDKFELPKRNKPAEDSSKGAKRRPSIRDLFGGDSDEEVDDELKQLVAQQGSINVHYPIKMPIVLKTSFINEDKGAGGDEVPISKKWIPIYPEAEKNKSSGPKWKAVGWTENDDAKAPKNRRMDDSQGGGKADAADDSGRRVKINNGLKVEKKDIRGVIVERRFGFSRTVELANSGSTTTTTTAASTTISAAVVLKDTAADDGAASEPKPSSSADVVVAAHTFDTEPSGDNLKADSGEEALTAVEKKVRVCKHGKVIKKEKAKETVAIETASRKRSQSAESVEDKKSPPPSPKVVSPTEEHDNKESGPQVTKRSRLSDEPAESADDVNWKKLSSSSKMRNYRDGKYRDSELLYKERPPRSSGDGKRSSHHREEERLAKSTDHYRSEREPRSSKYDDGSRRAADKSSSGRRQSDNRTANSSRRRSESRSRDVLASTWRRPSPEELKGSKSHKHHRRDEEKEKEKEHSSHHRHRHHRHHHHRHHHSSSKSDREKSTSASTSITKTEETFKPSKPSSTYQAYPVIKSFDSKQIYSDGDNIIINVNFKKEEPSSDIVSKVAISKLTTTIESSISSKSESAERKHSTASSANNSHKENVDILSPQSTDDYGNAHLQSDSNSITSPLSDYDYGRNSNVNSSSSNSVANNNGGTPTTSDHLKKILSEELNFLPRILQSTVESVGFGAQTPPDHFLGDSFMPTPTQDESHSPINGTSASDNVGGDRKLASSIHSTSPAGEEGKDDFYDPELPLQSPDRDSIKSPPKEKHAFESVSSGKESSIKKCDKAAPAIPSSTSSFSSSVAAATATLASLNNINISQLIQMAQTIGNKNSKASVQQKGFSSTKVSEAKARDAVESGDMNAGSPSPLSSPLNFPSSNNRASNSKGATWDQLVKVTAAKQSSTASKKQNVKFNTNAQSGSTDNYLIKLNRQERVVEELKLSLKPHFKKNLITKEEYKEILRKAVPKICHSKTGEINPSKIQMMVEQYIKRLKYLRKKN